VNLIENAKQKEKNQINQKDSFDNLPITYNHFEMLGITGPDENEVMYEIEYVLKNPKHFERITIPRDINFEKVIFKKTIDYLISDQYGFGIQMILILKKGDFLTCAPSFMGESIYSFTFERLFSSGTYEAVLVGKIPSKIPDGQYTVNIDVPNLIQNDFWQCKESDKLKIHLSGVFHVAEVTDFAVEIIERKEKNGTILKADMGRMGLLWPRQLDNPENTEYLVQGEIIDWRKIKNAKTETELCWMLVDTKITELEIVGNVKYLNGRIAKGKKLVAYVWLQGQIIRNR
jgi:hypothetical protein